MWKYYPVLLVGALCLGGTMVGRAHDLWLVPDEKIEVKKPATIRANSGSEFPNSEHAPDPSKFVKLRRVQHHDDCYVFEMIYNGLENLAVRCCGLN